MSVRCLNEKGTVVFIPEKLAAMPEVVEQEDPNPTEGATD